jgi:hypothetical protein
MALREEPSRLTDANITRMPVLYLHQMGAPLFTPDAGFSSLARNQGATVQLVAASLEVFNLHLLEWLAHEETCPLHLCGFRPILITHSGRS